ncbi:MULTISPECIES: XRE family transcriptional regulator [unclassified Aeromicrobium]|uniref:helix-turn-helix domain-containing protein n=1 Tax=unclassified Aeromicrobium TaxID=2633570 RepID=UPI00288A6ED7|nr:MULTISPECIES: XRE family transcriptional regulator [unclassified Aeromicrobium]
MDWFQETTEEESPFDRVAIGQRVRAERTRLGFKQVPFAESVGMSQASYSRLENGQLPLAAITSEVLSSLSYALGKTMGYLLEGSPVRDRVRLAARGDDGGDVASRADRVLSLLEVDDDLDDAGLASVPVEQAWTDVAHSALTSGRASKAQGVNLALHLRNELGLGSDPLPGLHDVVEERLGIDLAVVPLTGGLSAVAAFDDERHVVVAGVNISEPYARQRFSLAHEVAHILFGDSHSETADRDIYEMRADKFAQTLLIPGDGIKNWIAAAGLPTGRGPLDYTAACLLAEAYGVSPKTAWIALGDLGLKPTADAPTARAAAIETSHLTEHIQREKAAKVERIPARIEARVLAALRAGLINAAAAAAALGQDPSDLRPDEVDTELAPA